MNWVLLMIILVLLTMLVQAIAEINRLNGLLDEHEIKDAARWEWWV